MSRSPNNSTPARASITDSAWFWLMLFSCVSLLAMQLIDWKYNQRQAQLERQFQGRQWASRHGAAVQMNPAGESERRAPVPVVDRPVVDPSIKAPATSAETTGGAPGSPNYSRPGELVISLWPLRALAGAALLVSSIVLWRKNHLIHSALEPNVS